MERKIETDRFQAMIAVASKKDRQVGQKDTDTKNNGSRGSINETSSNKCGSRNILSYTQFVELVLLTGTSSSKPTAAGDTNDVQSLDSTQKVEASSQNKNSRGIPLNNNEVGDAAAEHETDLAVHLRAFREHQIDHVAFLERQREKKVCTLLYFYFSSCATSSALICRKTKNRLHKSKGFARN